MITNPQLKINKQCNVLLTAEIYYIWRVMMMLMMMMNPLLKRHLIPLLPSGWNGKRWITLMLMYSERLMTSAGVLPNVYKYAEMNLKKVAPQLARWPSRSRNFPPPRQPDKVCRGVTSPPYLSFGAGKGEGPGPKAGGEKNVARVDTDVAPVLFWTAAGVLGPLLDQYRTLVGAFGPRARHRLKQPAVGWRGTSNFRVLLRYAPLRSFVLFIRALAVFYLYFVDHILFASSVLFQQWR